jgi:tRNA(Ile)-lysidine synthase
VVGGAARRGAPVARHGITQPPGPLPAGQPRAVLVDEVAAGLGHLDRGRRVVVACSGGPDSSARAYLVAEARDDLELLLAYVDHGLRPPAERDADRVVVDTLADWLGADACHLDVEVAAGGGPEAAARTARYQALEALARDRSAQAIVLGHTADDQAETVLLRLARGTGIDGAAAMAPVAGLRTRPMLRLRREDVHRFVELEGLPSVQDSTNEDPAIRRVRVRTAVLPALAEVGPDPVGALGRFAALAAEDAAALQSATAALLTHRIVVGSLCLLPRALLLAAEPALARRAVRVTIEELTGAIPDAATVAAVCAAQEPSARSLPDGLELRADHGWWSLERRDAHRVEAPACALPAPGVVDWAPAGIRVRVDTPAGDGIAEPAARRGAQDQIALSLPGVWSPPLVPAARRVVVPGIDPATTTATLPATDRVLAVRGLRPGDRVRTSAGHRRVVELLRDAGVPRAVRRRWPLVTLDDTVVWIPGVALDAELQRAGRHQPGLGLAVVPEARGKVVPEARGKVVPEARGKVVPDADIPPLR